MKDNMEYLVVMDPALRLKFKEAQKNKDKWSSIYPKLLY